MVKAIQRPIGKRDLIEYLATASDFAFEMRALKALTDAGFKCAHGGTYRDPITGKARQFDIRCDRNDGTSELHLIVECKNLRSESPLLVHTTRRRSEEAYNNLILRGAGPPISTSQVIRSGGASIYAIGDLVGKQTDQVTRKGDGSFSVSDNDIFDKLQQAVNGCKDVLDTVASRGAHECFHAVVPVLLIPDDRLWVVQYEADGRMRGEPTPEPWISLFIGHEWPVKWIYPLAYNLSHIEVITESGFMGRLQQLLGFHGLFRGAIADHTFST